MVDGDGAGVEAISWPSYLRGTLLLVLLSNEAIGSVVSELFRERDTSESDLPAIAQLYGR